jgi:dihydrofolate reductase
MGRKTFESIYKRLNRPLPNRENVVLTRQNISFDGVEIIHDLNQYLNHAKEDIYIIGGKEIFNQTIDLVDVLYVTHIKHIYEGDQYLQIDFSRFSSEIIKETTDLIFVKYSRRDT